MNYNSIITPRKTLSEELRVESDTGTLSTGAFYIQQVPVRNTTTFSACGCIREGFQGGKRFREEWIRLYKQSWANYLKKAVTCTKKNSNYCCSYYFSNFVVSSTNYFSHYFSKHNHIKNFVCIRKLTFTAEGI